MNRINENGFFIISKKNCSFCSKAEDLLIDNGLDYKKIDNSEFIDDEIDEIKQATKHNTYPFVFLDRNFRGGYTELKELVR